MPEINLLVHAACIDIGVKLDYVLLHSNDDALKAKCGEMLSFLSLRQILLAKSGCLSSENSN